MIEVNNSSNIKAVRYDEETKELQVQFVSGKTYAYSNVPAEVGSQIEASAPDADASTGKLVNSLVLRGGYKYEQV